MSISIVTAVRNGVKFIPEYIQAIKSQTYSDWECILIDDCSTDESLHLVKSLTRNDSRFRILQLCSHAHSPGPSRARNLGLRHVRTDFIAFCDIDDIWHPEKLEHQIDFHVKNGLDISVTGFVPFTSANSSMHMFRPILPPRTLCYMDLLGKNPIPLLTVMVSSDVPGLHFPEMHHEDFAMWLNIFSRNRHIKYGCLHEVLGFYRIHSGNISHRKLVMPLWTFRVFRSLHVPLPQLLYAMTRWSIHNICYYFIARKHWSIQYTFNQIRAAPPVKL